MFFLTQEVHDISYSHEKKTPQQYKRANIQYDDKSLYISLNTEEKRTINMYNIRYTQALEHVT